ncbi:MAG: C25 family cysteine peptidase [Thermoanaerobaculales bacterium]|nr:C25 family cysteine peptidase [Thermoanaerobaculales bacterium]
MNKLNGTRMASIISRGTLVGLLLAAFLAAATVGAQTVPTGYQDYFVLGFEQHVWDMMQKVRSGEGSGAFASGMNSVVTAVASADGQILYYDHWEDGLEIDILNPTVGTTLVLGDGDATNGLACEWTTDSRVVCGGADEDTLFEGTALTLNSDVGLTGCTAGIRCSVPLNPRDPGQVRFDGGDRIVTSGGPLSVIHNQNPLDQFIGGATETISYQTVRAARSYSIPIGEDIYGGPGSATRPFKYVDIGLVAFEDDTSVYIFSPGETPVSFVLDRGESYSSLGLIDSRAAPSITINDGTKVSTDKGVAGFIHTGGDGTYATRFYTLLPDILHARDYVITAPGDDPTEPAGTGEEDRPANIYIFNPDAFNDIQVISTDSVGSNTLTIPANSSIAYSTATGRDVPPGSTVRMVSDRRFWGVSAYDYATWACDWGHSWLAKKFLTGIYTVGWSPGSTDIDPGSPDRLNSSPVYVAATQDDTLVLIDLDNNGTFDEVDLDGDGTADPAPLPGNGYVVNALDALSIFDHTDFDNTGTRIVADKPVAVAWGQETDIGLYGDVSYDTGYTVYPIDQLFLDPVLTLEKISDTEVVPVSGGEVTYTLTLSAYDFDPLTDLEIWDVLPEGVPATAYVPGSTLITYPDLSMDTADPVVSVDPESGRDRLDWTLSSDPLLAGQYITVEYAIDYPASATGPGLLANTAHAVGRLGGSVFSPVAYETVVQTDASLDKSASHDGTPQVGEEIDYAMTVANSGLSDETGVVITDPVPADTEFVVGSILDDAPFTGAYDPAQNAVVWTAASVAAGTGPYYLGFSVSINPGVAAETGIVNQAGYASNQTPYFTAGADVTTTGPRLEFEKHGPAVLHPLETAVFEIVVANTGVAAANGVTIIDAIPLFTTYEVESMEWSLNSGPFVSVTDVSDGDEGEFLTDRVRLIVTSLGPGEDIRFRFRVTVDPGSAGQIVNNQAAVFSAELPPGDTSLVQIPVIGNAQLSGRVFLDSDGDGVQDPDEPGLPNVDVVITDSQGNQQVVNTDAGGNYAAVVPDGDTIIDVDETDPDLPAGSSLSSGNDPQTITASAGTPITAGAVGYEPPPLSLSKISDASGTQVLPGQTLSYTITLTNYTGVTQTGIVIQDNEPANTAYVPGSSQVGVPESTKIRATEYYLSAAGGFSGSTFDLNLDEDLAPDYFVMIHGSDGSGGSGWAARRGPDENYVALTADPFGTGDLTVSGASNRLSLTRRGAVDSWVGVITVVECLDDCDVDGFRLIDVARIGHTGNSGGTATLPSGSWSDIDQVLLMGGYDGAGCDSAETDPRSHLSCHVRLVPSGNNGVSWSRSSAGSSWNATSTVMAVEWGAAWTVQHTRVQGNNGGGGADQVGDYNTSSLTTAVSRADTWVWGTGFTNDNGVGDTAEGCLVALGDGVALNATEGQVAVGLQHQNNAVDFEVWAMTHPDLEVDHRFKADGDDNALTADVAVNTSDAERIAVATNGMGSTSRWYWPASIFSARYLDDSTVRLERRYADYTFPAWVQGVDFSAFSTPVATVPAGDLPDLVTAPDGYSLAPGESLVVTFQVVVDADLDPSVTEIVNTASSLTDQNPVATNATVTDQVIRAGVLVTPGNAGFGPAGSTVTYSHEVVNNGPDVDSFELTPYSDPGHRVELIDPATGAVLAVDDDGDGLWDGGTAINTGSMAVGESKAYNIRVTIPPGTTAGSSLSSGLTATSVRVPTVSSTAYDETLVVDDFGEVIVTPDNSGSIETVPGTVVYPHHVINNTGVADVFDLSVFDSQSASGWSSTIHWDTNGDGVYTPGTDLEIANTAQLDDGESQLIFVVVTADGAQAPGDVNVSSLGAVSRTNPTAWLDGATDTTTVQGGTLDFDLTGGGTRLVEPGDTAVFPGRLRNLGDAADTYEMTITPSPNFGIDGFDHTTQLVVGGVVVAEDEDGDGNWDTIDPAYGAGPNGGPILPVPAGGTLLYDLVRPVDGNQRPYHDPVTLTAQSQASGGWDSVTATNILLAESRAVLAGLESYSTGGRVVVEWVTTAEIGTVGFDLYRRAESGPSFIKLNHRLLQGVFDVSQGGVYRFVDEKASPGMDLEYLLVERDVWGDEASFGPIATTAKELDDEDERRSAAVWDSGYEAAARSERFREPVEIAGGHEALPADRMKVAVDRIGLVRLDVDDVAQALGVDAGKAAHLIETGDFRMTLGGDEVAWMPEEGGGGLFFFGEANDSIYTRDNVYLLEAVAGSTMNATAGDPQKPQPGGLFNESLHVEQEHFPVTAVVTDPEGDFWMWDLMYVDSPVPVSKSFNFHVPAPVAVESRAAITVHLHGALNSDVASNHLARVHLNGRELGTVSWEDLDPVSATFRFPQELLVDGTNTLEIDAELVPGVDEDLILVDAFDVVYKRGLEAAADQLLLSGRGGRVTTVTGFTDPEIMVLDLTDRLQPFVLTGTTIERHEGGFSVTFVPPGSGEILAVATSSAAGPHWMTPDQPSDLRSAANAAEHLVIAGPGLADSAQALADHRTAYGLLSRVVRIEDVYDEFNHGMASPWAIRDFLQLAWTTWSVRPRFVALAGDGSLDYIDRLGGHENLIPAPQVSTELGLFGSDQPLADFDDDGDPEVALGRLPVHDAAELRTIIDKIIAAETADRWWRYTTLWVADAADEGGEFSGDLDAVLDLLGPRFTTTRIDLDVTGIGLGRQLLSQRFDRGAALVGFLGHAGMDRLGNHGVLTTADVGMLANDERIPVVTAFTCVAGRFDLPLYDTLAETILLREGGGAGAVFAPVGLTMNDDTAMVGQQLVRVITKKPGIRIGDATRRALWRYVRTDGADPTVARLFVLLGDPAFDPGW